MWRTLKRDLRKPINKMELIMERRRIMEEKRKT